MCVRAPIGHALDRLSVDTGGALCLWNWITGRPQLNLPEPIASSICVSCARGNVLASAWGQSYELLYNVLTLDFITESLKTERLWHLQLFILLRRFNAGQNEINIHTLEFLFTGIWRFQLIVFPLHEVLENRVRVGDQFCCTFRFQSLCRLMYVTPMQRRCVVRSDRWIFYTIFKEYTFIMSLVFVNTKLFKGRATLKYQKFNLSVVFLLVTRRWACRGGACDVPRLRPQPSYMRSGLLDITYASSPCPVLLQTSLWFCWLICLSDASFAAREHGNPYGALYNVQFQR